MCVAQFRIELDVFLNTTSMSYNWYFLICDVVMELFPRFFFSFVATINNYLIIIKYKKYKVTQPTSMDIFHLVTLVDTGILQLWYLESEKNKCRTTPVVDLRRHQMEDTV